MFNMAEFIKENLIRGFWDGSFTEAQVNIYAMNYLLKAVISQEDFDYILEAIKPKEDEEIEEAE